MKTSLLVSLLALSACAARRLPPPETPAATLSHPMTPAAGQVALETVDVPASVTEVGASTPLCTTPCIATLAPGRHELRFRSLVDPESTSTGVVVFGPQPAVYRHALGYDRPNREARVAGWVALAAASGLLTLGTFFGSLYSASLDGGDDHPGYGRAALGLSITGAVGLVVGLGLVVAFSPERRPGSGVEAPVAAAP